MSNKGFWRCPWGLRFASMVSMVVTLFRISMLRSLFSLCWQWLIIPEGDKIKPFFLQFKTSLILMKDIVLQIWIVLDIYLSSCSKWVLDWEYFRFESRILLGNGIGGLLGISAFTGECDLCCAGAFRCSCLSAENLLRELVCNGDIRSGTSVSNLHLIESWAWVSIESIIDAGRKR